MLDVPLKDEEFALIAQIMEGESGIHLRSHKKTLVYNRLRPRLRELGLSSFGQYLERLTADPAELTVAIDLISTNVTHFFREEYQFDYLRKAVLPQFRGEVWRGWSAGCSTGEEAYSLAITCHQALPTNRSWRVLATDISTRALLHAQQGIYPRAAVDHLPPGVVEKYFQISSSEEIQVRSFLRERIWCRYF
ncbi:MAG: CheR family methyltransferase, partial [Limnochordia bacterium]